MTTASRQSVLHSRKVLHRSVAVTSWRRQQERSLVTACSINSPTDTCSNRSYSSARRHSQHLASSEAALSRAICLWLNPIRSQITRRQDLLHPAWRSASRTIRIQRDLTSPKRVSCRWNSARPYQKRTSYFCQRAATSILTALGVRSKRTWLVPRRWLSARTA